MSIKYIKYNTISFIKSKLFYITKLLNPFSNIHLFKNEYKIHLKISFIIDLIMIFVIGIWSYFYRRALFYFFCVD